MYAVVATGGKQYRVNEGDRIRVEKLAGDTGARVVLDQVLMVGDGSDARIGAPILSGVSVEGEILDQARAKKLFAFRYKRRKKLRKKTGHRQPFTEVRITCIKA